MTQSGCRWNSAELGWMYIGWFSTRLLYPSCAEIAAAVAVVALALLALVAEAAPRALLGIALELIALHLAPAVLGRAARRDGLGNPVAGEHLAHLVREKVGVKVGVKVRVRVEAA